MTAGRITVVCLLVLGFVQTVSQASTPVQVEQFALRDIKLLDGPLKTQQELNRAYLHKLEPDRLLCWFRKEAGMEPKAPPYLGWESEGILLPGHILGFYMSGAAMTVQATGDGILRQRLLYIVDELADVQAAHGSGYMLAVPHGKALFADVAQGRIEIKGLPWTAYAINGHFEPTYTMNKLLLGLFQIVLATDSDKAQQVMLRLADWFGTEVVDKLNEEQLQTLIECEHGSLYESYVDAFTLSGSEKYLTWARRLCHERMLTPLAEGKTDFITYFHANACIPKFTGFQHVYRVTGEDQLHRAAMNFWNEVVDHRSWVIGGNSSNEHFFDPNAFDKALHALAGPESCNSVNMLRLTEALFVTSPSAKMMDFYERVLFNHLLSAHDNERAMCAYYTPMFPGAYRVYSDPFDSMWCCTGTGLEVPGKYGHMIYTHSPDDQTLHVNLFAASELNWAARGVIVRQTTGFPYEQATTLSLRGSETDQAFTLCIRHPAWVPSGQMTLTLNGRSITPNYKDGYAKIRRRWKSGDSLRVDLPMQLDMSPLPGHPEYVAFLYGPVVLSGALGRTGGLTKEDFWEIRTTVPDKLIPDNEVPKFVLRDSKPLTDNLYPVEGKPLHFRTTGLYPSDVNVIPFFENHFQRYALYWRCLTPETLRKEQERKAVLAREHAALEARTVDSVMIGNPTSEQKHELTGRNTQSGRGAYGQEMTERWRDARDGGWFSYRMVVGNKRPLALRCTYWGREFGQRTFDVLVNGQRLATQSLRDTGKEAFFDVDIPLPPALLADQESVTVKLQARPGNTAGGLFGLRILRVPQGED